MVFSWIAIIFNDSALENENGVTSFFNKLILKTNVITEHDFLNMFKVVNSLVL